MKIIVTFGILLALFIWFFMIVKSACSYIVQKRHNIVSYVYVALPQMEEGYGQFVVVMQLMYFKKYRPSRR